MNKSLVSLLFVVPAIASFAACSSSTTTAGSGSQTDAGAGADSAATTDAPTGTGTQCTAARDQLLLPIDKVSTGQVSIVSDTGGVKTIYVDASAGGQGSAAKNPRVYVNLATGTRVDVTDKTAPQSTEWDLSLKRTVVFTNSGDAGIGTGGAAQVSKAFASVAAGDADGAKIAAESFFDDSCTAKLDPIGAPATTFSDWYDYDQASNVPTPKPVTYVVKGASGKRFKVGIKAYDALPDGGSRNNASTGFFLLQVSEL